MIDLPAPTREAVLAQLLHWLPGVYRARDAQGPTSGVLRQFLSLFADELWRIRRRAEQQHADHFIDSAQDWMIPYIADLVGSEVLFTGEASRLHEIARRNRDDVKNTVRWRRQKGTVAGLEGVVRDVAGWGTHVVEMFERVAWMQNLTHIKKSAVFAVDLRDGEALARACTPFGNARRIADLRTPDQRIGWHQTRHVCAFEWPIASFPARGLRPAALGGGRFTFDPLGTSVPLFTAPDSETQRRQITAAPGASGADIAWENASDLPIRTRDLRANAAAYVATPLGFTLREDGIPLLGGTTPAAPSIEPCLEFARLERTRGLIPADITALPAGIQVELAAIRLGARVVQINTIDTPVPYSPGQSFDSQLVRHNPHGRLSLDTVTPDFSYTPGMVSFDPEGVEHHHAVLLLSVTNQGGAAVALPESEVVVRNRRGHPLLVVLPAIGALAAGAEIFFYVAADGSTYFARGDHGAGVPDRNPDSAIFGAYQLTHLARASEGQRRIRPGHPAGAARYRQLVARDLCCWDKPLHPPLTAGTIAIDPERGRFMFPAGEMPTGALSADFRFGRTTAIGAGPFTRANLPASTISVARSRNADFVSLQAAINAAPNGGAQPVVIEVLDSDLYDEAIVIANRNFPGGLVIQAAPLQMPFIRKPAAAPRLLHVANSTIPSIELTGLVMSGGIIEVGGAVDNVRLHFCTLQPESVQLRFATPVPVDLTLRRCISGPVDVTAPGGQLVVEDSVVHHPAATIEAPSGVAAIAVPASHAILERATILGDVAATSARISNSLCYGAVALADMNRSCLRFSRLPAALTPTRAFQCTSATPVFVSIGSSDAGYCHLHPNTSTRLTRGGEEGGEMGAYASAGLPWRTQSAGLRLSENIPAGLTPLQIRVLPRQRFRGNRSL